MRLLLADDHDLVRETIAAFLLAEGFTEIVAVASLPQAIQAIVAGPRFDLVLLDYQMPGMNGLEGLAQALAVAGETPVALLSGTTQRDLADAALKAGAAGFVPKTLASRAMVAAVQIMVGARPLRRSRSCRPRPSRRRGWRAA